MEHQAPHSSNTTPDEDKKKESPQTKTKWGFGRVAFNANLTTIEKMHEKGFPNAHIYRELEDKLGGLSYTQFGYHLRKHRQNQSKQTSKKLSTPPNESQQLPSSLSRTHKEPVNLNDPHPLPDNVLF